MDDSAVSNIVRGTSITSGLCTFATGLYGIYCRQKNYGLLSLAAGVNSGVTAFAFFSIRELAVSPVLLSTLSWPQYERRRQELGLTNVAATSEPLTWSDLRQHKTLDSGLSGALAGGLLRGWRSGPRAILPGALSIGAVCTLLQIAYNEVGITRLRYISGRNPSNLALPSSQSPSTPVPPSSTASVSRSMSDRLLSLFGVQPVTDEQYLAKLKATRDGHLKRIAELEKQLEEEQALGSGAAPQEGGQEQK